MGLDTKQVSGDQTLVESGSPELSKPPPTRRQQPLQEPLKCPRCSSTNTKFCYYNNYNKSQPRHFCKSCKRHWTYGGTLRNVPVGGVRKNKMPNTKTNSNTTARPATIDRTTVAIGDQKSMSTCQALSRSSSLLMATKTEDISDDIIPKIEFPMSSYQDLSRSSSPLLTTKKEGISNDIIPKIEFPIFTNLSGTWDANSYFVPTSYDQSYNTLYDHYLGKIDSTEESIITNIDIPTSSGTLPPWCSPDTDISTNGWNWNDIDFLNQWS